MVRIGPLSRVFILLLSVFLYSCDEEKKPAKKPVAKQKKQQITRPNFNADSAFSFVQKQVDFGPRVPNTEAHKRTAAYLSKKINSYGFNVSEQKARVTAFNGKQLDITNIIGSFKEEKNNRIMLFAHWDSRPFADQDVTNKNKAILGANDGASGVGVLLEVARQIQIKQPNIGVDIMFFDAEDYGQPASDMRKRKQSTWCLGSQYWANNMHKAGYSANFGILLDMVGAKDALFTKEAISMYFAPEIVNKVWRTAYSLGHNNHFIFQETQHVGEDDHLYINKIAGIPSIDIIQYDPNTSNFAPHWHTHNDNMSVIERSTLQAVGETLLATIFEEAK